MVCEEIRLFPDLTIRDVNMSCTIRTKTRQYFLERLPELPVCQSVYKWVATAVQHRQRRSHSEESVGEWASAVCKCETRDSNEMRDPAEDKCSVHKEKSQNDFHLFPGEQRFNSS